MTSLVAHPLLEAVELPREPNLRTLEPPINMLHPPPFDQWSSWVLTKLSHGNTQTLDFSRQHVGSL